MGMVEIKMRGRTPYVQHNGHLADPDNEFVKEIKVLSGKKTNKTEDDRREIERLEWFGSLYRDAIVKGPIIPTNNLKEMLIRTAAATDKRGKVMERAITFTDHVVPLSYDGPRDFEELWKLPQHRWRTIVKIGSSRVPKMRPIWPQWSIATRAYLMTDILDFADFCRYVELAGQIEGQSDARSIGYGRFTSEVIAVDL